MYSNRFSLPEPVNDSRLLKNSWRLKLDFVSGSFEDDEPGTIRANYELQGEIVIKPGEPLGDVLALIDGFRTAQAEKGGSHEANF